MDKEKCSTCGRELSMRWLSDETYNGALQSFSGDYCPVCEPKEHEKRKLLRRESAQRLRTLVGQEITVVFRFNRREQDGKGKIVDFDEEIPQTGILKNVDEDLSEIEFASGEKVSLYPFTRGVTWQGATPVSSDTKCFDTIKRGDEVIFSVSW